MADTTGGTDEDQTARDEAGDRGGAAAAPRSPDTEKPRGAPPGSDASRTLAVLSYVFFPFALLALLLPPYSREEFVRYHAMQALALWGIGALGGIIPCVGPFVIFVALVAGILAALGAWGGDYSQVPFVSGFISSWVWP